MAAIDWTLQLTDPIAGQLVRQSSNPQFRSVHKTLELMPGLTFAAVHRYLGDLPRRAMWTREAQRRSGWYMQQLLKLGAVHSIPTLSSWYNI